MTLKVLKLAPWMLFKYSETPEDYINRGTLKEIDPILNRSGYYRHKGRTWFENNEKAYEMLNDTMFEYSLSLMPSRLLRECEVAAIKTLRLHRLPIHPVLLEQYRVYLNFISDATSSRDIRKRLLTFKKIKGYVHSTQ